jgi:hypothetical protein
MDSNDNFETVGLRLDIPASIVLGKRHVLSVGLSLNYYLPPPNSTNGTDPMTYGLDKGGTTVGIMIGYTMRFTHDLGPGFIVLE